MKKIALACLAVAPLLSGCTIGEEPMYDETSQTPTTSSGNTGTEHSATLETSQMTVSMSAQSDGTTVKIYAALFDAASDVGVTLDQGDFFTASAGEGDPLVLVLEPSSNPYVVHYAASLPASASAQDITIGFVRNRIGVSAPNTILHVPASFTVASTDSGPVPLDRAIDVQAQPVLTGDVEVQATGACLEQDEDGYNPNTFDDALSFDSNGNAQFSSAELVTNGNADNCAVTIFVSAISDGSIDPNFYGGATGQHDAEGVQTRSFVVTLSDLISN